MQTDRRTDARTHTHTHTHTHTWNGSHSRLLMGTVDSKGLIKVCACAWAEAKDEGQTKQFEGFKPANNKVGGFWSKKYEVVERTS